MSNVLVKKQSDLTNDEVQQLRNTVAVLSVCEHTRPLTAEEVSQMLIKSQINSLNVDDQTASRMTDFHPTLTGSGALIVAGTRINWKGQLKRAAVDLWDTAESTPDAAPALWEDLSYRNGVRVIPETITAGLAFGLDELGWWGETLYRSTVESNVWTPEEYPDNWEAVGV